MAEREEQAHRVVRERREAKPLVDALRTVVRGVHDEGVHGHILAGGHDALDRIGEKHVPQTIPVSPPVDRQPADQGVDRRADSTPICTLTCWIRAIMRGQHSTPVNTPNIIHE